jgi:hypothetical protein
MQQDEGSRQIKTGKSELRLELRSSMLGRVFVTICGGYVTRRWRRAHQKTPLADLVKLKQLLINNTGP